VQADEVKDELEVRFEAAVEWLKETQDTGLLELPAAVPFSPASQVDAEHTIEQSLLGKTIAIAKDAAFSFIYDANLIALKNLGANLVFFSPLKDQTLPEADALWLPGGYPELHSKALSENTTMRQSIKDFYQTGKGILAECGGMLYSLDDLTDLEDKCYPMVGILSGQGAMRGKRGCQGMQTAVIPQGEIRGHAHHRSRSANTPEPVGYGRRQRHPAPGEAIYQQKGLTASYLHLFFPSNLDVTAKIFLGKGN
jgi:cobyrinic acid a,c-diamide synthase